MARMVPALSEQQLAQHRPTVEATVYRALRDLTPDDWLIFFSLRLVKIPPDRAPELGELDFVVFCQDLGVLVVEVKGGVIELDGATQTWTSIDQKGRRHVFSDPMEQAASGLKEITRAIRHRRGWTRNDPHYLLTGTALLFPDVSDITPLAGPNRPLPIIAGSRMLDAPEPWIRGAFDFWATNNADWRPLGPEGMEVVEQLFAQRMVVARPLAQVLRLEHERQIELTQQQAQVLRVLRSRHRALVAGPAGTGKTLLALQQARYYAGMGTRTLFVCFNRALSDFLARDCYGVQNLDALTFHMLCQRRISAVKKDRKFDLLQRVYQERGESESEDVLLAYALARSTEEHPFRYQAMVVDEGQDFSSAAFLGLRKLLEDKNKTPLFVFYDSNQAIYRKQSHFPISDKPYPLTLNCRNTHHIHHAAYAFFQGEDPADPPDVTGEPIELLAASELPGQAALIRKKVGDLVSTHELDPGDVAVLVAGEPKDAFYNAIRAAGHPDGAKWAIEKHWVKGSVVVDTVRRFKGLEAIVSIVWGIEYVNPEIVRELLYVALSRARSRLWLVGHPEKIRGLLRASAIDITGLGSLF